MNTVRFRSRLRWLGRAFFAAGATLLLAGASLADEARPQVYVMTTTGIVDHVMADYLHDGFERAANEGFAAVIIELDTPGGELGATDAIVQSILDAPLPVITWVAPVGARAASAGTFITIAGHVAVMAPGTRIGAAAAISGDGTDLPDTLADKVREDSLAMLRAIKELRPSRNTDWAYTTVIDAKSYAGAEALAAGGIDGICGTLDEVLAFANGRSVIVKGQPMTLALADAVTTDLPMNVQQNLLRFLADPNIAFILFTVGVYGLLFELQNPNFVTGTVGAIAIVLAVIGFGSLPVNIGGLVLVGIGIVLFLLEPTVTSHGLLAIGGIVCFALGAAALYTDPVLPGAPDISVALPVILTMTVLTGLFMVVVVWTAIRTRHMTTAQGLIGAGLPANTMGEVRRPLTPLGSVYAGGEEWSAKTSDERPLDRGTPVRILRQEGLTLIVEPGKEQTTNG
ncbi:MAG TPA: nodulation protein NfeD [Candidatus Limnocylindrales bacterium]